MQLAHTVTSSTGWWFLSHTWTCRKTNSNIINLTWLI